ncbi:MAG: hypothetical protein Q7J85_05850, partial [Bacillota bacterium]|nr:hypothetical protein [Bacillota bacterium]
AVPLHLRRKHGDGSLASSEPISFAAPFTDYLIFRKHGDGSLASSEPISFAAPFTDYLILRR